MSPRYVIYYTGLKQFIRKIRIGEQISNDEIEQLAKEYIQKDARLRSIKNLKFEIE